MSSSRGFSPEELASLMPWRLPQMDDEAGAHAEESAGVASVVEEEVEIAPRLTAEAIEAMQQQAYEEASKRGQQEGWEQGHRDGYAAGYAEGLEQARTLGARLEQIMALLDEPLREMDEQVIQELTALAIAVARQLIRRELRTDPGQIIAVVREAMAILPANARRVSLHLHPDDAELVRVSLSLDENGQRWKLLEDPLLTRGGCRVTSDSSAIDASIEKRLAAVIVRTFGGDRGSDGP